MEDSDIKIFGQQKAQSCDDEVKFIAEMERERANGNIDEAVRFGEYLADLFLNEKDLLERLSSVLGAYEYPTPILYQMKILMFFSAEYTLNRILPNAILKSTAVNALYGSIKNGNLDFYKEFSDGAEYSFYYLAMRKESQSVITEIGKAFAMLCGQEDDANYVELGKHLFNLIADEVGNIFHIFNFVTA